MRRSFPLRRTYWFFLLFAVLCALPRAEAFGSEEIDRILRERKKLERDLSGLKKQLGEYRTKLKQTRKKETQSLEALKNYNRQLKLLEEMIGKNREKLRIQDEEIGYLRRQLEENRSRHDSIAADFQRIAVTVYKNGSKKDIELLFAATSLNQAIVRSRYMGFFSEAVMKTVYDLKDAAQRLKEDRALLEESYRKRAGTVKEQRNRVQGFSRKKKEKEAVLGKLKKNKKVYAGRIEANRKKLKSLQTKIEELIRAEQAAIEREREQQRIEAEKRRLAGKAPLPDVSEADLARISTDFDKARGLLPWPVENGVVVRKFGSGKDPDLNIVTTSNGIDISVSSGSVVRAVSGGKIAQIAYLPTYGNIVIIRHAKSYLTVYANLSKISVAKGDEVVARETIGSAGPMPEGGSLVHFEIWKGKVKQDPLQWLKQ